MARLARGEYLDPQAIQIVHVTSRCVRRAFLCGRDPYSGNSYEHRREWIRERLEHLASAFAIDCLTFSIMSNHMHLVLRSRPDIVRGWSDREVVQRWLRICPPRRDGQAVAPTETEIAMWLNDPRKVAELRIRLSDISWWMRLTAQKIARQANQEDECTGRFWEGRYRAQLLLDEAAILTCAMYVDLNPIRAALAQCLEDSEFTGAHARIDDLKESLNGPPTKTSTQSWERSSQQRRSGWLSPVEIAPSDPLGPDPSPSGRRASSKGFLSLSMARYLELLDWTGRQLQGDKRNAIPPHVAPILQRIGIDSTRWLDLAQDFGRLFKRAAGTAVSLSAEAQRRGQRWLQAPGARCFQ